MKKKIKKTIIFIILIISICGLIYSLLNIKNWTKDNGNIDEETDNLQNNVAIDEVITGEEVNSENKEINDIYWDYIKMNMINVDLQELKKINKDTIGWIQVNGTNINYPFVQGKDNKYYLTHSFYKKDNEAGWIFLDYRNNIDDLEENTIIYGHSRIDKSMFGSLKYVLNNDWIKNKDNYIIKLSTEKYNTLWQVFSIYHIKTETYYITTDFTKNEYKKFVKTIQNRSLHDFETTVDENDKILTLSTCYSKTERMVLHAKLIKKEAKN